MSGFRWPDWQSVFVPDGSLLESFVRATVVYFAVLALIRIVLKRQRGSVGLGDLLLLLLLSECVSQALNGQFNSVPNGVVAVATLLLWTYLTDHACYRWKWAQALFQSSPVELVRDGRPIPEHLRQERIDDDELKSLLRRKGLDDTARVRSMFIESEGEVSVVKVEDATCRASPVEAATGVRPDEPPDFDATMRRFLDAAHQLQHAAVWHDDRAAEHKRHAAEAREVLKRFGVQPRALLMPDAD